MSWLRQSVGPGPRGRVESSKHVRHSETDRNELLTLYYTVQPVAIMTQPYPKCIRVIALLYRMCLKWTQN